MIKTNFHTHTVFCDGKNTPEEMIIAAVKKGFSSLGFSGHSFFTTDDNYSMNAQREEKYFKEVTFLKEKYKDKIQIFCGIEQDYFSDAPKYPYDYIIGSVHSVYKDGEYLIVDGSLEEIKTILEKHYNNDFDTFAKDYFETESLVLDKTNADIIGHFDLILKNMERLSYTPTKRFFDLAEKALLRLIEYNKPFEINTGAMARGYRSAPYPHKNILKMIFDNGGKIIFSSDCHDKDYLDCAFDVAEKTAKEIGFTKQAIITKNGIEYIPI